LITDFEKPQAAIFAAFFFCLTAGLLLQLRSRPSFFYFYGIQQHHPFQQFFMKKIILHGWLALVFCSATIAQSPYQLKPGKELAISFTGLGLAGASFYFDQKTEPLTLLPTNQLSSGNLSDFERWVTSQSSVESHKRSNILLFSSQAFPVALTLFDKTMRKDAFTIATLYGETALLNISLTSLAKNTVRRTRPYVYGDAVTLEEKMTKNARQSFYSGHTSQTAAMCFLTARLYASYHPGSRWKPVVWTAAATIPAVTGLLRMTSGKHFPTDVLVGYITGAAIGYFIPRIHLRRQP
jgi:hypothetical protein